jgi:uncharacterized damage-inducible protein DinB
MNSLVLRERGYRGQRADRKQTGCKQTHKAMSMHHADSPLTRIVQTQKDGCASPNATMGDGRKPVGASPARRDQQISNTPATPSPDEPQDEIIYGTDAVCNRAAQVRVKSTTLTKWHEASRHRNSSRRAAKSDTNDMSKGNPMYLSIEELISYTDEERARWEKWFAVQGDEPLQIALAGDKHSTVGMLILHIFGPELRYVERLRGQPVTEYRDGPTDRVAEIFAFGHRSRAALREYVQQAQPDDWGRILEFNVGQYQLGASARKIVLHVLLHEIRHWAQIARIMREHGLPPPGGHDLLLSNALE